MENETFCNLSHIHSGGGPREEPGHAGGLYLSPLRLLHPQTQLQISDEDRWMDGYSVLNWTLCCKNLAQRYIQIQNDILQ